MSNIRESFNNCCLIIAMLIDPFWTVLEYKPKAVRNSSEEANISLYTVLNLYCVSFILLRENLKCPLVS
jgi:hypothetical protein